MSTERELLPTDQQIDAKIVELGWPIDEKGYGGSEVSDMRRLVKWALSFTRPTPEGVERTKAIIPKDNFLQFIHDMFPITRGEHETVDRELHDMFCATIEHLYTSSASRDKVIKECAWSLVDERADGTTEYLTGCGEPYIVMDDRPLAELGYKFCYHCGRKLKQGEPT